MNETKRQKPRGLRRKLPGQLAARNAMMEEIAAANTVSAWRLRTQGRTISEIASELGVCESSAKSYLQRGLEAARDQYTATAADHLQIMLGQIEDLVSKWRILADCPAAEGADRAAAIVLRALEQKSKLLGLDGNSAGLVVSVPAVDIDVSEALKSKAARDALREMLDAAEGHVDQPSDQS